MKKETLESPIIPGTEKEAPHYKSNRGRLDAGGREVTDGRPMAPPLGYKKTESLAEQIRRMVQDEHIRRELENSGIETFDEANDFDIGDDVDPSSPYEVHFSSESFDQWLAEKNAQTPPQAPSPEPPGGVQGGSPPAPSPDPKAPTQA